MNLNTETQAYRDLIRTLEERSRVARDELFDDRMARIVDQIAEEIRAMRIRELTEAVTVQEAAEISGYSESTIWRYLESGQLQSVGEPGKPLLRVADLPFKPGRAHPVAVRQRARCAAPVRSEAKTRLGGARLTPLDDAQAA